MTKDQRRFMRLQDIGCICCLKEGFLHVPVDVHHIVDKGYREHSGGHRSTLPLCPWHHRGVPPSGLSEDTALFAAGPSLALHKRRWIETYGTERELLAEVDRRIEELERAA
jgi:hypothetical protein